MNYNTHSNQLRGKHRYSASGSYTHTTCRHPNTASSSTLLKGEKLLRLLNKVTLGTKLILVGIFRTNFLTAVHACMQLAGMDANNNVVHVHSAIYASQSTIPHHMPFLAATLADVSMRPLPQPLPAHMHVALHATLPPQGHWHGQHGLFCH